MEIGDKIFVLNLLKIILTNSKFLIGSHY